ncbi:MAG: hypothetical protein AAF490_07015 [Chloroflexota bacterium]
MSELINFQTIGFIIIVGFVLGLSIPIVGFLLTLKIKGKTIVEVLLTYRKTAYLILGILIILTPSFILYLGNGQEMTSQLVWPIIRAILIPSSIGVTFYLGWQFAEEVGYEETKSEVRFFKYLLQRAKNLVNRKTPSDTIQTPEITPLPDPPTHEATQIQQPSSNGSHSNGTYANGHEPKPNPQSVEETNQ